MSTLYIKIVNGLPTEVADTYQPASEGWESCHDWRDLEWVQLLAQHVTKITQVHHIAVDEGPYTSPRFDVIRAPAVGDKVSYGFNGDYNPDGEIVRVTAKFTVTTSTGNTYRRRRLSSSWFRPGGVWGLVPGHRSERNPSF